MSDTTTIKGNSHNNLTPEKVWPVYDAAHEFVRLAYLILEGYELKVPTNPSYGYAVQTDAQKNNCWQTCWWLPGYTLEAAQQEAARLGRKRKYSYRVVRFDTIRTIVEPMRKAKKGKSHE